jgi:hypothetical protein
MTKKFCGCRAFNVYDLPSHPAGADLLANKIREISSRRRYDNPVTQPPEIVGHKQTFEPRVLNEGFDSSHVRRCVGRGPMFQMGQKPTLAISLVSQGRAKANLATSHPQPMQVIVRWGIRMIHAGFDALILQSSVFRRSGSRDLQASPAPRLHPQWHLALTSPLVS